MLKLDPESVERLVNLDKEDFRVFTICVDDAYKQGLTCGKKDGVIGGAMVIAGISLAVGTMILPWLIDRWSK